MARDPIPTWFFALVVARKGHRFLVVHERKHGQLWYIPAGRVEAGETLVEGARRETLEESGVPVEIEGIYRIEHSPSPDGGCRVRVVFAARPVDDSPPKQEPDKESLEARWVTLEELENLPLRGAEIVDLFRHVAQGAPVYPISMLTHEGAPYSRTLGRRQAK